MELLLIKKSCRSGERIFNPGEVYLCGPETKKKFQALNGSAQFLILENELPRFIQGKGFKELLLVRGGGIGDLMALSSIITYLNKKNIHTWFWTQRKYFNVFDWFNVSVKLTSVDQPLFTDFNMNYRLNLKRRLGMMQGERMIEQGSGRNWYEIFFEAIGAKVDPLWFRPQLLKHRVFDLPVIVNRDGILICHRATAIMRSARFEDIHKALRVVTKKVLYVHRPNLTKDDQEYIIKTRDPYLIIIPPGSMEQFLCDIYDAGQVISMDSVAVHFREGVEKPAIGLYSSFTTEARTKYYQFVKTFDLKSQCPSQPCFMHQKYLDHTCDYGKGMENAPCLDGRINKDFTEQLTQIFSEHL